MSSAAPIHLRPTAPLAPRALLPGDPGRALSLAQILIEQPRMFNHHRGLWGYTGPARADGAPLTIQSTGMGGPSAAIVFEELICLGVTRAIRVGTCGALHPHLRLGDLIVATEAIAAGGASRALGAHERVAAHPQLASALRSAASPRISGPIVTTDLFYDPSSPGLEAGWQAAGALAVEMESAALFAVGERHGVPTASLLAVSDVFPKPGARERIADDAMHAAAERMGRAAVAALTTG